MGAGEEREERGQPPALALPGAVSAARCGLHKGRPRPPRGTVAGRGGGGGRSCSGLPQLSDVGGEERGRAGGQSAELGSQRGAPRRRPQPPTVCKRPAPGQRGAPCRRKREHPPGAPGSGSAPSRLWGRAPAGRKWNSRHRRAQPGAPGGRGQTEGAARRCAPSLSLSLGETNLLSGSQLSNLPIMILA